MKPAGICLVALLLLLGMAARAQTPPAQLVPLPSQASIALQSLAPGEFDAALIADVFAAGLAFVAPRALEKVEIPEMALWGLRGLSAIDPLLSIDATPAALRLSWRDRVLFSRPLPQATSEQWGLAASQIAAMAMSASAPIRRAGSQAVVQGFFDELFNHLDPYSRYEPPSPAGDDQAKRWGQASTGLTLDGKPGAVTIAAVQAESPADQSGLKPGERITAIDGVRLSAQSLALVANLLAGPEGSDVRLTLAPAPGQASRAREVQLTRSQLPPETVFSERLRDFALLRIVGFSRVTDQRLRHEIEKLLSPGKKPVRGLILDLRDNRGGLLRQAAAVADSLLNGGLVASTVGRDPRAAHEFRADPGDISGGLPIVVLIDGRSASAAEILAAALADGGRAVVVGSASMGKGLVQSVTPMPDGGTLFVTWSRVVAPDGWPIQALGVMPQICTSLGGQSQQRQLAALSAGDLLSLPLLRRHHALRSPITGAQAVEIRNACPAAEGSEADIRVARSLLEQQAAYGAALLH